MVKTQKNYLFKLLVHRLKCSETQIHRERHSNQESHSFRHNVRTAIRIKELDRIHLNKNQVF